MPRPIVLALVIALGAWTWGCGGGPDPQPSPLESLDEAAADHLDDEQVAAARRAREAARRELPRLLPLDRDVVRWYEVRREEGEVARRVAVLTATRGGPSGARTFLEAIGLTAPGEPTLRLWRGVDEVWVLPAGALGPEVGHAPYRAWTPDPAWDDGPEGRGRRGPTEPVPTLDGEARGVRVDHARSGDVLVRHVFAPGLGLVALEVLVRQQRRLRLDLVEVGPRGAPPEGYDASTPGALWRSVTLALDRADVDGLTQLMSRSLRRRGRTSAWARVHDLAPPAGSDEPLTDRVRAELGELLELDVRVRGAWAIDGDEASAPAFVTLPAEDGAPRTVRGLVVLRRRADEAWRWEDLRIP